MAETTKEKILQHETLVVVEQTTPFAEIDDVVKLALQAASEKKAVNTVALDLRKIADFTEFFIITGGTNSRQVQAIADEIEDQLKKNNKIRPIRLEGYQTAEWILMDYGDFVVHIFDKDARSFYDLERLWRDAQKVQIPDNLK
jgi:ribosome-associated protein